MKRYKQNLREPKFGELYKHWAADAVSMEDSEDGAWVKFKDAEKDKAFAIGNAIIAINIDKAKNKQKETEIVDIDYMGHSTGSHYVSVRYKRFGVLTESITSDHDREFSRDELTKIAVNNVLESPYMKDIIGSDCICEATADRRRMQGNVDDHWMCPVHGFCRI